MAQCVINSGQAGPQHQTLHITQCWIEWAKVKWIHLFTLICSVMPDNSIQTVQKTATMLWFLTSRLKLQPLLHVCWLRPITCCGASIVEDLQSQGLESVHALRVQWNWNVMLHFNFFYSPSLAVSNNRCERVCRGPLWREGPVRKLLWLLRLSVSKWLQPGDHPEQEVLSRWDTVKVRAGNIMFPLQDARTVC